MENLITYPVNNVLFDAEDAELFHCTRTSGVFMGDDFSATAGGSDATVIVSEGLAWIRDAKFKGKAAALKSTATLSFTVSDATYPRYDAITLRYDIAGGKTTLLSRSGTASSNPVKPSPVRNASVYELMLYHVYRPAGSSVITQDNIIDLRNNSEYCGYMVDDVSAFDEGKFLAKDGYDPTDAVANSGGIAAYVSKNSTKVTVENSVSSTSTTNAASADAVRRAYSLAKSAIPSSDKGAKGGTASLDSTGKVPGSQLPKLSISLTTSITCNTEDENVSFFNYMTNQFYDAGDVVFFDLLIKIAFSSNPSDNTYSFYCTNLRPPVANRIQAFPFVTSDMKYFGTAYISRRTTSSSYVKLVFTGSKFPGLNEYVDIGISGCYSKYDP